ncbi:MAG: alpha/beta fold hydrolase [Bowdeniella nasicola]|nr:alpha/beta fold hydrolase [Bowdeniella nasicola]
MDVTSYRVYGHSVQEITLDVPHNYSRPSDGATIKLFARIIGDDQSKPYLLFLQGGPGSPAPRQGNPTTGWIGRALQDYRVVLLDQRGTGRSTRIDAATLENFGSSAERVAYLKDFRADAIVGDCETLRAALNAPPWYILGQSYGGFCITTYLSTHPEGVAGAYITGGLPGLEVALEDNYRATYRQTIERNREYFAQFPDEQTVRDIIRHLDTHQERLPTGEVLSSRRFRTIGINLGTDTGYDALHFLLESPFCTVRGHRRLSQSFLTRIGAQLSFADRPLYALMHETIYAGRSAGLAGIPTAWAAERVRAEFPEFGAQGHYLTGEHIYPWQFEEDPALIPLRAEAHALAHDIDFPPLYDLQVLATNQVPVVAAVYTNDMFVPTTYSLQTAELMGAKVWQTDAYQHDGLRASAGKVLDRLIKLGNFRHV